MFRRVLMRRAYNAGRYQQARRHARLLLGKQKEAELARSVIVRSYWNEHAYDALIQVGSEWEDDVSKSYVALAREHRMSSSSGKMLTPMKESRLERLRDAQPGPQLRVKWNPDNIPSNFFQEGHRLWFRYPQGYVYWDMPASFVLSLIHISEPTRPY